MGKRARARKVAAAQTRAANAQTALANAQAAVAAAEEHAVRHKQWSAEVARLQAEAEAAPIICAACKTTNSAGATQCASCASPLAPNVPVLPPAPLAKVPRTAPTLTPARIASGIVILACLVFAVFHTDSHHSTPSSTTWTTTSRTAPVTFVAPTFTGPTVISCQVGLAPIETHWSDGTTTGWTQYCQDEHDAAVAVQPTTTTTEPPVVISAPVATTAPTATSQPLGARVLPQLQALGCTTNSCIQTWMGCHDAYIYNGYANPDTCAFYLAHPLN